MTTATDYLTFALVFSAVFGFVFAVTHFLLTRIFDRQPKQDSQLSMKVSHHQQPQTRKPRAKKNPTQGE